MSILQIAFLAIIQGAAELLPVSSSAHVVVAEKIMGLNPSAPEMTFLLVMLHTGTMFAVLFYFWSRWKKTLNLNFIKSLAIATLCTGALGIFLKKAIEKASGGEVEDLFGNLPLIAGALLAVGLLIIFAGTRDKGKGRGTVAGFESAWIGLIQGLCLPFRGFSRSGATISTALVRGISRTLAEDFSFALAVILTPAVIALELRRLLKSVHAAAQRPEWTHLVQPGLLGMAFSFIAGLLALRWLSIWLENGKWKYFGYYCIIAAGVVFVVSMTG